MIDLKILKRAILVGVFAEVILVAVGHLLPRLRADTTFLFGCMMIAAVAGLLYARDQGRGFGAGALGGAVAGAASGLGAVGLSSLLRDRPDLYLPYGVMVSTLTGAVGGVFGQLDARMRALIASLRR